MNKWLELAAKCEAATGPDRGLDREIGLATGWKCIPSGPYGTLIDWDGDGYPDHPGSLYPSPTESLDAITALIERELPGKIIGSNTTSWGRAVASVENTTMGGKTEALARCAAFCRAMAAKSPEEPPEAAYAGCK